MNENYGYLEEKKVLSFSSQMLRLTSVDLERVEDNGRQLGLFGAKNRAFETGSLAYNPVPEARFDWLPEMGGKRYPIKLPLEPSHFSVNSFSRQIHAQT